MGSLEITKPMAAQRQIDAAIRMLFSGEDTLAVHTVAAAAHRIVLDLTEKGTGKRGQNPYTESLRGTLTTLYRDRLETSQLRARIQNDLPQFQSFFLHHLNRPANFLKHANRDAGESLDENSLETDLLLLVSCTEYKTLGFAWTTEMLAFCIWHLAVYPNEPTDPIKTAAGYLHDLSRPDQLECGNFLLGLYRDRLKEDCS